MKISIKEVDKIRMSVKPHPAIVEADYNVIHDGHVKHWVGIGWITHREATKEDYESIPELE